MSFGKTSGSSAPVLTQEQKDAIKAQTGMLTDVIIPTYQNAIGGAKDIYNKNAGGVLNAAQNLAGTAGQAQQTLGETGESALRTGISGLESLFNPDYEANQIQAALAPAQSAYEQNITNQRAQFGGTGNLGSARQALAERQTAGQAQAMMAKTAADIQRDTAMQRAGVGQFLASQGAGNIGQALGAAGQQVSAAMTPQDFYSKYASVIFGTPGGSYNPDFRGTQGMNTSGSSSQINLANMFGK